MIEVKKGVGSQGEDKFESKEHVNAGQVDEEEDFVRSKGAIES